MAVLLFALLAAALVGHTTATSTNLTFVPAILRGSGTPAGFVHSLNTPPSPTIREFTQEEFGIWAANASSAVTIPRAGNVIVEKRSVIGTDDRYLVPNSNYPFGSIGRLYVSVSGGYGLCTGTLVGPRLMASARHCMISGAQSFLFQPGYSNGDVYSSSYVTEVYSLSVDSSIGSCDAKNDWALFVLSEPLGTQHGYLGVSNYLTDRSVVENKPVLYNAGYASDLGNSLYDYMSDSRTTLLSEESSCANSGPITGDCDVASGMSGGPLWLRADDNRWTYGTLLGHVQDSAGNELHSIHAHGESFIQGVNNLNAMFPN